MHSSLVVVDVSHAQPAPVGVPNVVPAGALAAIVTGVATGTGPAASFVLTVQATLDALLALTGDVKP